MYIIHLVVVSVVTVSADAIWYEDILSHKGWEFGDNILFHVEDTKAPNTTYLDRLALRVDYGKVGVSAVQNSEKDGLALDFYLKDKSEGRGNKMGSMMIPFMIGAMKAGIVTMIVGMMKVLAMKALILSKVALLITAIILLGKLAKKDQSPDIEVEHLGAGYPVYEFGETGYATNGGYGNNYGSYAYNSYSPSAAESSVNYAAVMAPGGNDTVPSVMGKQQPVVSAAAKRRDHVRRKEVPLVLTIKRFIKPDK